jgi:tetratricopeptide (TPR) repeat protein
MSPEQAGGEVNALGPASDVYSLGATLYSILTGRTPVEAADTETALRKVRNGEVTPPRAVRPQIPKALEAVCLKALALKPEGRYATASDLGADLDRWLADEPVAAYREPWTARARRWSKRHRTLVTGASLTTITATVSMAVGLVLINEEKNATRFQRDRAVTNFGLARSAVKDYLTEVTARPELKDGKLVLLRKELLDRAAAYFEKFIKDNGDTPEVRKEFAESNYLLGAVYYEQARYDDALKAHRKALTLRERLATEDPTDLDAQHDLAQSLVAIGNQYQRLIGPENNAEAEAAYRHALEVDRRLVTLAAKRGGSGSGARLASYNEALAEAAQRLGEQLIRTRGSNDVASECFREAVAIREARVKESPGDRSLRERLAVLYNAQGEWHRGAAHRDESLKAFNQAREIGEALVATNPRDTELKYKLGMVERNLAAVLIEAYRADEAATYLDQARKWLEDAARAQPFMTDYRESLGLCVNEQALQRQRQARNLAKADPAKSKALRDEELKLYRQLQELAQRLVDDYPEVARYSSDLARAHKNIGVWLNASGRPDEALAEQSKSREILEALVARVPDELEYRADLAASLHNLAGLFNARDKTDEARALARRGIEIQKQVYESLPRLREILVTQYTRLSAIERHAGRLDEATAVASEARKLASGHPLELVGVAVEFAMNLSEAQKRATPDAEQVRKLGRLAVETLDEAAKAGFNAPDQLVAYRYFAVLKGDDGFKALIQRLRDAQGKVGPGTTVGSAPASK